MKKLWKILLFSLLTILLLGILSISLFIYRAKNGLPFYEYTPPELPPNIEGFSILLFSKTNGFPHTEAIEAAIPAFEKIAQDNGWSIFSTNNGAVFNKKQLSKFDVVIWNNATGRNLTDEQRKSFEYYMNQGGGFLGIHGTGDDSHHWDWYEQQLIGANFSHHPLNPQLQKGNIHLECDTTSYFPCENLPQNHTRTDEWYVFFDNPRASGFKVLYTLEESGLVMNGNIPLLVSDKDFGMGDDHPIVWYRCLSNGGRTFYSAMGHTGDSFREQMHLKMLENAIKWVGKLEGGCD